MCWKIGRWLSVWNSIISGGSGNRTTCLVNQLIPGGNTIAQGTTSTTLIRAMASLPFSLKRQGAVGQGANNSLVDLKGKYKESLWWRFCCWNLKDIPLRPFDVEVASYFGYELLKNPQILKDLTLGKVEDEHYRYPNVMNGTSLRHHDLYSPFC